VEKTLSEADRARIIEAIRLAESKTAGEIYVVVARHADEFRFIPVLWGALAALIVVWPLLFLTDLATNVLLILQALTFVTIAVIGSHPSLRYRLVPSGLAAQESREAALAQFLAHGIHRTERRTGVLIYVALAERRVEVVADAAIDGRVDQPVWDQLASHVAAAARAGVLADGLVTAVARTGGILSEHFPPTPFDINELADRVVEI
jgi:putative membrane protein